MTGFLNKFDRNGIVDVVVFIFVLTKGFIGRFENNRDLYRNIEIFRKPVENTGLSLLEGVNSWVLNFSFRSFLFGAFSFSSLTRCVL